MKVLTTVMVLFFAVINTPIFAQESVSEMADAIPQSTDELDATFQGLTPEEMAELEAMETDADINDSVSEGQAATLVE